MPNQGRALQGPQGEPFPIHLSPGVGEEEGTGRWSVDIWEGFIGHGGL